MAELDDDEGTHIQVLKAILAEEGRNKFSKLEESTRGRIYPRTVWNQGLFDTSAVPH